MSHSTADESKLQAIAKDLLEDPIGKANHIVTLLKAVHESVSTVGASQTYSCAKAVLRLTEWHTLVKPLPDTFLF